MHHELVQHYWWCGKKKDIAHFVSRCLTCQRVKCEHQRPGGISQRMHIPTWKWERITLDFVVVLSTIMSHYDSIWVVVDSLTKSSHFILVRVMYTTEKLVEHGLGTWLDISTSFNAQIDGHSERMIHALEDILQAYVIDFGTRWDQYFPLEVFSYNNNYHSSIQMGPFEALHGAVVLTTGREVDHEDEPFLGSLGCLDLIVTHESVIRLRRKGKLSSRFNDNFEILSCVAEVAYNLALPLSLSVVHLVFHVSMLRKYVSDESHVLSPDSVELGLDLSFEEDHIPMLDGHV
ncbi:hypothetical protein MTR67_023285 [Solanum verrucosum]|uniref:Integrase zinc-binding domain-containing protein n=1 Tax=Solanum verrucosum TaxID=315347 RepID=A0AAF0QW65_SOLVR|nr:hypothetical protein MTR67_023285 [Solanum verrucosum]